jgi:hypothetical protein
MRCVLRRWHLTTNKKAPGRLIAGALWSLGTLGGSDEDHDLFLADNSVKKIAPLPQRTIIPCVRQTRSVLAQQSNGLTAH